MTELTHEVYHAACRYFDGVIGRVHHFTKVLQFATVIGEGEHLPAEELETLQITAILHDIGIPNSEKKYGNAIGRNQQIEGPPVARELLAPLGLSKERIERVCGMIALHHSFSKIGDDLLLRILVEADMLVNAHDDSVPRESLALFKENVVKTKTGKQLFEEIFKV